MNFNKALKIVLVLVPTIVILHYINTTRTTTTTTTDSLSHSTTQFQHWENITDLLREESPDVFENFPTEFRSEYKSFCWNTQKGKFVCLPNVYLAGMPKCGSTDLFDKLVWHPDLMRPAVGKENHYWARSRLGKNTNHLQHGLSTYSLKFDQFLQSLGPEMIEAHPNLSLIDGTQSMLWDLLGWEQRYPGYKHPPYSNAELSHRLTPQAKVLVITRDPVRRLYSDYLFFNTGYSPNVTANSFHASVTRELQRFNMCLEIRDLRTCCYDSYNNPKLRLNLGIYICFVRDWKEVFGEKMLVISLEDYSSNPLPTLAKIFDFLEVAQPDPEKLRKFLRSSIKSNSRPKSAALKGDMLPETKRVLQEFYKPYNREFAQYLKDTRFLYKYDV